MTTEENSIKKRYGAHEGAQIKNALKEFAKKYALKKFGIDIKQRAVDRQAEAERAAQMANDALAEMEMSNDLLKKIQKYTGWDEKLKKLIPLIKLNRSELLQQKWDLMKTEKESIAKENFECKSVEDYVDKMIKNRKVTEITDSAVALGEILKNLEMLEDNDLAELQEKIQVMLSSFGHYSSNFGY